MFDDFVAEHEVEGIISEGDIFTDPLDNTIGKFQRADRTVVFYFEAVTFIAVRGKCSKISTQTAAIVEDPAL